MWFKQTDAKSPQQPEAPAARPQPAPTLHAAPAAPVEQPAAAYALPAIPATPATASRITAGIRLKGDISGQEDLWIGGSVDGSLRFETGRVMIGSSGAVEGEIEAREIAIEGKVDGDLRAIERLEIMQTGRVRGDATSPRISIQEGAVFNGSIEVLRAGESRGSSLGSSSKSRTSHDSRGQRIQNTQAAAATATASAAPTASRTDVTS